MGHGSVASNRWQPDRNISDAERATFWQSRYLQTKSERDYHQKQALALALRVAELEKMLVFKKGDEVGL